MYKPRYNFKYTLAYNTQGMARILANIEKNQQLLNRVRASLPGNISAHAVGCVITNDRLLVFAESATWATRLRFHANSLLAKVNGPGYPVINKVIIRMTTGVNKPIERKQSPKNPTLSSIEAIQHSAHATDGELQKSLLKLSKTLKSRAY